MASDNDNGNYNNDIAAGQSDAGSSLANEMGDGKEGSASTVALPAVELENQKSCENLGINHCAQQSDEEIDRDGRVTWLGQFDFLMTLIGLSVGTGNIWRFPYLCFRNGGGVFFIPYFISLFCAGIPLLFLEISLGQFMTRSSLAMWDICPLMKGIGVATAMIVFYLNLHYIIVLAWSVYYLFASFTIGELPWANCKASWTDCFDDTKKQIYQAKLSETCQNYIKANTLAAKEAFSNNAECGSVLGFFNTTSVSPAESFWEREVLGLSTGISDIGSIQPHLALSLLVAWLIVYFCIIKGVAATGKVVWVTGLFPYFMLVILFFRGVTLPGAMQGIEFYLKPDLSKLSEAKVWLDAGTQIFYSMSIGVGSMTAMGSYNTYRHNCLRDSLIYSAVNSCTSIFGGFIIFAILGHMAHNMGVSVEDVAKAGPGLTFVAYPKAVTMMPASQLWAIAFFIMLLFLGLDSEFVAVEGFAAQVMDALPFLFNFKRSRQLFITLLVIVSFIMGLFMVTNGGMYLFQILDFYSASGFVLLFICACEILSIAYGYGGMRYVRDLEAMMGYKVPVYFPICWYFVSPAMCCFIFFFAVYKYEPLTFDDYIYPFWSAVVGWGISLSTCVMIPIGIVIQLIRYRHNISKAWTPVISKHQVHPQTQAPYIVRGLEDQIITNAYLSSKSSAIAAHSYGFFEQPTNGKTAPECHVTAV